jgi:hypothetical protein
MTEPRLHALLSPSGAAGWLVCAGKPAMERDLPDDSNKDSDYGTAAHEVASMCLTESKDPAAYRGRRIAVGHHKTIEVDEKMVDGVRIYVEMVQKRIADYQLLGATSVELLVEQRVPIGHITGEVGAEGTADVVIIVLWPDGTALIDVVDLKFGVGVKVYAENNPQAMMYALGAVEKFSIVTDFDRVRIGIHQPRVSEGPSDWELSMEDLQTFGKYAAGQAIHALAVYEHEKPGAYAHHLTPGDHCKKTFCKARATCPKLALFVQDSVGADFETLVAEDANGGDTDSIVPSDMPAASIAVKFKAIDIIEDWCKAVRAKAEAMLFDHGNSPEIIAELGIKLVQGKQGNRAWSSAAEAEAAMKSMRLKVDEMYDFSLISPTTAEKVLKDSPKKWKRVEALITRSPGKPSVAPASDKRPPLEIKVVAEDFDVVDADNVEDLV